MNDQNFTTSIVVDQTPAEVYKAITNPRAWWSEEITGTTDELNAEWNYQFGDNHRSKMKVIEMILDKKVVWLVEENYFKNAKDQSEWVGNKITFDILKQGGKTELVFTQYGLVSSNDCYKACDWAWTGFVQQSLQSLIATGKGKLDWFK
ncbi:SRPBCC family protein [Ferruginibacter sp.]